MSDETINVVVEVDDSQLPELNERLAEVEQAGERVSEKMKEAFSTFKDKAASAAMGFLKDNIGQVVERLDAVDSARKSLVNLGMDATAAENLMHNLQRAAEKTPVALDQITDGAKRMVAAGMDSQQVEQVFKAISDAAYGIGDGGASIDPMISAFEQMQSSAKLSLDPLKDLEAQGVPALKILANQAGISAEEMEERISSGAVDSKEAIEMLVDGIENGTDGISGSTTKMAGLAEEAGRTLGGSFERMKTAVIDTIGKGLEPFREIAVNALLAVTEKIREFRDMVLGSEIITGFFSGLAEVLAGLGSGVFDVLIGSFQLLFEVAEPILQFLADRIGEVGNFFSEIILTYIVPALESFKFWLGENQVVLEVVAAAVVGAVLAFMAFQTVTAIISGVTTAIALVKTGLELLGLAMAANPIGLLVVVIGAVVGALIYLYQTNETVREYLNMAWEELKLVFAGVWEYIQTTVLPIVQGIFDFLVGIWESWAAWWNENSEAIKLAFQNAWTAIQEIVMAVMAFLEPFLITAWENIQTMLSGVWEIIKIVIEQGSIYIQNIIMAVMNIINGDWSAAWENIKNVLGAVWTIITEVVTTILNTLWSIFSNSMETISGVIISVWNNVSSFLLNTFNSISSDVANWLGNIGAKISEAWNAVKSKTSEVFNSLRTIIWDSLTGALNSAKDTLTNWGTTFFNAGKGLIDMIAGGIRAGVSFVTDAIDSVVSKVRDFLPFSPAKTGPLSDLDKLNFGGTISTGIYGGISDVKKAMNKMTGSLAISPELALGISGTGGISGGISQIKNQSSIKTVNNSPSIVIEKVVWEGKEDIRRTSEELTWMSQHEERGLRG